MCPLRDALAGLTFRGRAFVAAGVTALACAIVLDQTTLQRAALLGLLLPLVAAVVLARSQYRLALGRVLAPGSVPVGQRAEVTLTVTNEGRTPSGVLRLEEQVPYALGARPRFVLDGVGRGWRRQVRYEVRCEQRGRYVLGPMRVLVGDPFGLVALRREFTSTATLLVTPKVVELPAAPLPTGWSGSGDQRPRPAAVGSAEDLTVRGYRIGDDLRRVHWRSSARAGELMVRQEEQPWQARATVLLDDRAAAHAGSRSGLEAAVSAAASVGLHLARRGYEVRLLTTTDAGRPADPRPTTPARLLERLAEVEASLVTRLPADLADRVEGDLLVAVLGSLGEADVPLLARARRTAATCLALRLGDDGALLAGAGWRQAGFSSEADLPAAWVAAVAGAPAGAR
ncbi:DUF58 domain-containing protein [Nocardioides sp. TRM66260-LWL]|uniref:DUF58 domain-containing protein n=1 Tax=Nocardioides sp. TRM66260-LWL TaxID=2874478 RepID=UPI001CC7E860|nr:DUF58 domain-containing protein [Nocardioides sp. TRM66260-LWL]MBZ5733337.1 DUF58 domain-containing protein [Nocardioides sp. TRM66260-LWL]